MNSKINIKGTAYAHYTIGHCHNQDLNNDGTYVDVLAKRRNEEESPVFLGMMVTLFTLKDKDTNFFLGRVETLNPDYSTDINLKSSLKDIQRHQDIEVSKIHEHIDEPYRKQSLFQNYKIKILGQCFVENGQVRFVPNVRKMPAPISLLLGVPNHEIMKDLFKEAISQSDTGENNSFEIGTLQYGTIPEYTNQYYDPSTSNRVPVYFNVSNLLRKRTGIFGKSGYGKSNTVKTTLGMLSTQYPNCGVLIFDTNGEYALDNDQNDGFMNIFQEAGQKGKCVLYSQKKISNNKKIEFGDNNFKTLRFDVFSNITASIEIILSNLNNQPVPMYLQNWVSEAQGSDDQASLFTGSKGNARGIIWGLWFYSCLQAGLIPINERTSLSSVILSKEYLNYIANKFFGDAKKNNVDDDEDILDPTLIESKYKTFDSITEEQRKELLTKLDAHKDNNKYKTSNISTMAAYGKWYFDQKENDDEAESSITGYGLLTKNPKRLYALKSFHLEATQVSTKGANTLSVGENIWNDLKNQKIVIVDLASIPSNVAKVLTDQVAGVLLSKASSMFGDYDQFEAFKNLEIVVFIEEAQNYLSTEKMSKSNGVFERLAKEGRKFHIGLVYITQQPSAIDTSITSQTENLIVMHLSNGSDTFFLNKIKDKFDLLTCRFLKDEAQKGLAYIYSEPHQPFVIQAQIHKFSKNLIIKNKK